VRGEARFTLHENWAFPSTSCLCGGKRTSLHIRA